jgi:hypothetical protein
MATYLFARGFSSETPRLGEAFQRARGQYFKLLLSQLPGTILAAAVLFWSEHYIASHPDLPGNMVRLARYGGLFLGIAVQAVFAFTMVLIVFEGATLGRAFRGSFRLAARNAIGAFMLLALPILLHYPAVMLFRRAGLLVQRGAPEMLAAITGGDMLVGLISNYLVMAAITRFYLAGRRAS